MRLLAFCLLAGGLLALSPPDRPIPRREFRPAVGNGRVATFSATGHLVAVGGGAAPVAVFETRTGLLLRTYAGHTQPVTALAFAPHPDTVLSADASGQVRLWSAETLATLAQWQAPAPLLATAFAPGGGRAVLASAGTCWLWNLRTPGGPTPLKLPLPAKSSITAVAFGAEGRQLALGFDTGAVLVYDLASRALSSKSLATSPIRSLCLHADTLLAATGGPDLKIWPARPDAAVTALRLPQALNAVALDATGRMLALGFATGETMLWSRAGNRAEQVFQGPGPARRVQFQPEGAALVLTSYEAGGPKTWLVQ